VGQKRDPPEWSESDRARLDSILKNHELDEEIKLRRQKRIEAIKVWAQWIAAVSVAGGVIWDGLLKLIVFVRSLIQ
jgi:3-keto-L-gulonate-6-phosphate decarboxylase